MPVVTFKVKTKEPTICLLCLEFQFNFEVVVGKGEDALPCDSEPRVRECEDTFLNLDIAFLFQIKLVFDFGFCLLFTIINECPEKIFGLDLVPLGDRCPVCVCISMIMKALALFEYDIVIFVWQTWMEG